MEYAILEYMDTAKRRRHVKKVGRIVDRLPVSRRQLARAAGVSHSTINRIAKGDASISYRTVQAIADTLARWKSDLAGFEAEIREVLREWEPEDSER